LADADHDFHHLAGHGFKVREFTARSRAREGGATILGVSAAHFQQAGGEIGARHRIVRAQASRASANVGGGCVAAVERRHARERRQNVETPGRGFRRTLQNRARLAAVVELDV
jgi:hypothetical protein